MVTVKLVPLIVAGAMASLKVAVTIELVDTFTAPAAGTVRMTVGRDVSASAAVMKLQTKLLVSAMAVVSCAAVVTVATHSVLGGKTTVGVSVATRVAAS